VALHAFDCVELRSVTLPLQLATTGAWAFSRAGDTLTMVRSDPDTPVETCRITCRVPDALFEVVGTVGNVTTETQSLPCGAWFRWAGHRVHLGSVGVIRAEEASADPLPDAEEASAGDDPYIYPLVGPPLKLPNADRIYRLYEDARVVINAEVARASPRIQRAIQAPGVLFSPPVHRQPTGCTGSCHR